MSVNNETPLVNFIVDGEANSVQVQAHSGTRKRKKPIKMESKSITQKEFIAADSNEVNLSLFMHLFFEVKFARFDRIKNKVLFWKFCHFIIILGIIHDFTVK